MIIAEILVLTLSWPEDARMFTQLLQVNNLPRIDKARAHLGAGRFFESQRLYSVADEHFGPAEDCFKDLGHAHGELDIMVTRCGRDANWGGGSPPGGRQDVEQPNIDQNWQTILPELFTRYKELAFPVGLIKALLKLGELARLCNNPELDYDVAKVCSEIADETGSRLFWVQFQIHMLSTTLSQSGNMPTVIASGISLLEEIKILQIPYFEGTVASILSLACSTLADNSQSVYWAGRAAKALKESITSEQSLQEYNSAVARFVQAPEDQASQYLEKLSSYLSESIEKDVAAEGWKCCADKIILQAQVEFERYRETSVLEAVTAREVCLQRALRISEKLKGSDRLEIFASAQSGRAMGLLLQAKEETSPEKERSGIECLHSVLEMCSSILTPTRRAQIYLQLGLLYLSIFPKTTQPTPGKDALVAFRNAYEIFKNSGNVELCVSAMHGISKTLWLTSSPGNCPLEQNLELLSCFLEMEKWADLRRNELSTLRTLDAIRAKQRLSSHGDLRDMYSMSLGVCIQLNRSEEGWYWIQKAKARSVSDLLGLGIKIPESLMVGLRDDPVAISLLEEETAMQKTTGDRSFSFRSEMDILHERMEEHDGLRRIIELRKGHATTLSNLQWAFDDKSLPTQNRSIIFVDWALLKYGGLFMFVVDESRRPLHFRLKISITDIKNWCEAHWLDPEDKEETLNEEDDEESAFRELDELVSKLQSCSKPGDLLVLSPTELLHSIPLHALRVPKDSHSNGGSMLLIERNPVIYCPSITILEQCVLRAQSRLGPSQDVPPVVFAVYEPQSQEEDYFNTVERTAVYQHAGKLGQHLHASVVCGNEVTKKSFSEHSTKAPLIHFHGHCNFDTADVLAQSLILCDDGITTSAKEPSGNRPYETGRLCPESPTEFSVEDIFNLNLSNPHITLIACDSASQRISAGDEPFGILTAFLCAGATSIIGTMWPTATREGRAFSEAFYRRLGSQESAVTGIFDYAGALREAALIIRSARDSRLPYFWAPFVLHGAWFGKSFNVGPVLDSSS